MPRPTEFVDLKQTSVTLERAILDEAKKVGINISEVLRDALHDRLGEVELKREGPLQKFKGLPKHLVTEAVRKMKFVAWPDAKIADWFNEATGAHVTSSDIKALIPTV